MKLMKSFVASVLVLAGSSAFAAGLQTVTVDNANGEEALRWSSQCIANELDQDVKVSYLYGEMGEDAEWKEIDVKKNTIWLFRQRFSTQQGPLKFTVKFMSKETDGTELSYELEDAVTILKPVNCSRLENYEFQATDAGDGSIDLVHVGE